MKIISLTSADGLYKAEFSDGSSFSFRSCYLPQEILKFLSALDPENLNPDVEEGLRFAADCLRAERAALRLIARAEQCSTGLSLKLGKRKFKANCTEAVISRLIELKLIDDRRFACLWLESRLGLRRSPHRLLAGLVNRGIDMRGAKQILNEVLDEEAEFSLLLRFAEKYSKKYDTRELKHLFKREGFSSKSIELFFESF
jgi:regulatory protein